MQSVTISLFRFNSLAARLWVLGQMALARPALARLTGLQAFKLCGSGTGEGFTPRPNWGVWAIVAVWDDDSHAREAQATARIFRGWRHRAAETWTLHLEPYQSRGRWAQAEPFAPHGTSGQGPILVLTRASVRLSRIMAFWRRVPDISARIGANTDVLFKIGIGEVPFAHQVTVSIWPDADRLSAFAHHGPHAQAIKAVRQGQWFAEELYARFRVSGSEGTWGGRDPLSGFEMKGLTA